VYLPDYAKADRHIFEKVGGAEGLDRALLNAARLRECVSQSGAHTPATDMHLLVEALRGMAFALHL
jgi:hypothetical protein